MLTPLKRCMFQSLFYWIIYSYNRLVSVTIRMSQCFNPYFTGLSILMRKYYEYNEKWSRVSILILLDYLFLSLVNIPLEKYSTLFQSLFYWIIYSYLIRNTNKQKLLSWFQSLFYWIIYSYNS